MPDLDFSIIDAEVLPFAAAPTLLFKLRIENAVGNERIESILLRAQVRLEVTRRQYDIDTEGRLFDLFGDPSQWGDTLHTMLWTNTTAIVSRFTESCVAELPIACSYDFDVAAAKYFYALEDGEVPLIFLFSGTVFYSIGDAPMQIAQIPWEKEAAFRLPVERWRDMMNIYFPNSAWLRVRKDVFDQLYAFKARRALPSWEAALDTLLQAGPPEMERH